MGRRVNVIGVGMTKFAKPGASEDYNVMATKAARAALEDAGVDYADVEQAYAGYVYGDCTCGQRAVYDVGLSGIPVFNVNNNCSTGSTRALPRPPGRSRAASPSACSWSASRRWRRARSASKFDDRANPLEQHAGVMNALQGFTQAPPAAQMFGGAGREYRWRYGTKRETFAKVASKARKHAANNPYAIFNQQLTVEEVLASDEVFDPAHPLPVLPADLRRRRGRPLLGRLRPKSKGIERPRVHRGAGDDDRLRVELRGRQHDQDGRLRHDPRGREEGLREGRRRPGGRGRGRAARLLHHQRGAHLRGARPLQGGRGREVHLGRATTPTAASSSSTPRAACSPRATRSAPPASPSAPSWSGSSAARPTSARSRAPRSRSSTTSASAAPASSRCTGATERSERLSTGAASRIATRERPTFRKWRLHPRPGF